MTVPVSTWATYIHWLDDCQSGDEMLLVLSIINNGN